MFLSVKSNKIIRINIGEDLGRQISADSLLININTPTIGGLFG